MIRQPRTTIMIGTAIIAICLFGCDPEPQAPAPNVAPAAKPWTPVESTELQAAAPQQNATSVEPPAVAPVVEPIEKVAANDNSGPQYRTAFYRADANQLAAIPPVVLSKGHAALCRVQVGDMMPEIQLEQVGGGERKLADLLGKKATVVVFWKADRHMAQQELADLGPDVLEAYGKSGLAVVGIAVGETPRQAQEASQATGAGFPMLLDPNGEAFAKVGSEKLPRTFLLDPQGKILWFDIEYSLATRRELHQALRVITSDQ